MVRATVRLGSMHPHCEGDHPGQVVIALPLPAAAWKNALMHISPFQSLQHTQDVPLFFHPRRSILVVPSSSFHPPSLLHHHHHVSHLVHNSRLHRRHGAYSSLHVRGTRSAVRCEACLHYPAWLYFLCLYLPLHLHSRLYLPAQHRTIPNQGPPL